jgi:predicted ribosomally synthesized peptide with nif11-like leader
MKKIDGNEELIKKLFSQETPEDAQTVLKEYGFDFTTDEIKEVGKLLSQLMENKGQELSDDELENVAGGGYFTDELAQIFSNPWGYIVDSFEGKETMLNTALNRW